MSKPNLGLPGRTPPRARGGCRCVSMLALLLFLCAVGALGAAAFVYLRQQDQERAASDRPIVLVTGPVFGASAYTGSYLTVSATALGRMPIARAELWVDGELKETQKSVLPEGDSTFYAHFDLLIPSEGPHFLSVRAVNALGIIGKSLPVTVVGGPKPGPGEVFYAVRVKSGETLADIAKSYGSDPATLQKINPDLGGQAPAADTFIKVPVPPKMGEEAPAPSPASPPPPLPGSAPVQIPDVPMLTVVEPLPLNIDLSWLAVPLTYPAPPDAPKDLQGQVIGCEVLLRWNDLSNDESRYEVWTALGMLSPQLVAELKPSPAQGPAWYKFRAPRTGWVTFWVEAVNAQAKQPSNEIGLFIDPQKCAWTPGNEKYLIVQVFDMTVKGNYDKVYCYVSYENNPEQRIPESKLSGLMLGVIGSGPPEDNFIQVKGGKADFSGTTVGQEAKIFAKLVPIPQDGSLDVQGKCLGWSGKTLQDLGTFAGKFTVNDWDGARRTVKGASYEIEFAIKPWTPAVETATMGKFWYEDPTLPAPYNLSIGPGGKVDPRERVLYWKWDDVPLPGGDPKPITGFQVFLDDLPYGYFTGTNTRQALVQNFYCGKPARWQVSAVSGLAQSPRSATFENALPECQLFAQVTFKTLHAAVVNETCETIGVKYAIWANNVKIKFWTINIHQGITCRTYTFKELSDDPPTDTIIVPLSGQPPSLRFGTDFYYLPGWPYYDTVPFINKEWDLSMPPEKWENFNQDFGHTEFSSSDPGGRFSITVNVRGFSAYWKK